MSFWYLPEGQSGWPLVGEFSFDYDVLDDGENGETLESYPSEVARGARRLFNALQSQEGWFDLDGTTKTAFALEAL